MRKPADSQEKSSTPWEESDNSNLIHFLHLDKGYKTPWSRDAYGKYMA